MTPHEALRLLPGLAVLRCRDEIRMAFQASEARVSTRALERDLPIAALCAAHLTEYELRRSLHLNALYVPAPRRWQGLGSEALRQICSVADSWQVVLVVSAYPYEDTDPANRPHAAARLEQFFTRFGDFDPIGPESMFRRPFL